MFMVVVQVDTHTQCRTGGVLILRAALALGPDRVRTLGDGLASHRRALFTPFLPSARPSTDPMSLR